MFQNINFVEQSTFVSDFILAIISGFLSLKTADFKEKSPFSTAWSGYFKLMALTALVGGFGHLLNAYIGVSLRLVSWLIGLLSMYFLEKELLKQVELPANFHYIPPIKGLIFGALAIYWQVFTPVKAGLTLGMVFIVCPILFYFYHRWGNKGYLLILAFILANGFAGIAHSQNITLGTWCNGNDLAHYISAICLIGMFLGVKIVSANYEDSFEDEEVLQFENNEG
jgi:hypothetical protein